MPLARNDETNLKRNESFLHGRCVKTNWVDGLECLLGATRSSIMEGMIEECTGEGEPKISDRREVLIPGSSSGHTWPRKTRVKGVDPAVASGPIFIRCSYLPPGWAALILLKFCVASVTIVPSSTFWKYSLLSWIPGHHSLLALLKPLGQIFLVLCLVPSPLPAMRVYTQLGSLVSSQLGLSDHQIHFCLFFLDRKLEYSSQPPLQSGVAT